MVWKGYDFFPHGTRIDFMRYKLPCLIASIIGMLVSLVLFFTPGLNYGIDFKGGTLLEIQTTKNPADIADLRRRLGGLGLGDVQIQEFGKPDEVLIRIETQPGGEEAQQKALQTMRQALGDEVKDERRIEVVGPAVSSELRTTGIIAVLVSILAIVAYVWFRFEWQFAAGVVIALFHDVLMTVGVFAILQLEFDLSVVAALLTIVGYSVNDSVVVADRIRENLRKYKKMPIHDLLNLSVNETLSRTILTGGTTLLVLLALFFFGGEVIKPFTFAMLFGIIVGTYSSIFIAAPVLEYLNVKRDWSGSEAKPKEQTGKA
jgi:preprotein translocase SecF subunit